MLVGVAPDPGSPLRLLCTIALALCLGSSAWAQEPSLPRVDFVPEARFPEEALREGLGGTVLLELDLDATGQVLEARLLEPAGHGFDEAVLAVVHELRFHPATDEAGQAVPARIQYAWRFEPQALPVRCLSGTVQAGGTRQALANASVVAESLVAPQDGTPPAQVSTMTDEAGAFEFFDLAPGPWRVMAVAPGFEVEQAEVALVEGQVVEASLWLSPDRPWQQAELGEVMEIVGQRLAPELTERRLDKSEVRFMPGTGGDIVRAVQTQPGVARTPFNTGTLLVRGTPPDASGFFLAGVSLPIVFHFGGLSTVINSDTLAEVAFLPGSYGVRYGRRLGGVVDLLTDPKLPSRSNGYASVDLFQSAFFHEQKLGRRDALTLSARRSYIDAILSPIVNLDPTYEVRLPSFTDGQLRWLHRMDDGSSLEAMLVGSDDRFTYTEEDLDAADGKSQSKVSIQFAKAWLRWRQELGGGWLSEVVGIAGPESTRAEYMDDEEAWEEAERESLRMELSRPVPDGGVVGWRMGVDVESVKQEYNFEVEDLAGFFPYGDNEAGEGVMLMPAVYLEQTQKAGPVEGTPGVRVDWLITDFGYRAVAVDPRFRLRAELGPVTELTAGVGRYSQFPLLRELYEGPSSMGSADLVPESAVQATVGVRHAFLPELRLEGTLYHSWLSNLVVGHDDRFELMLSPPPMAPYDVGDYANEGTGRSFGLESLLRYEDARTTAFLALTLSRATRVEREGQDPVLFNYDQPVMATVVGSRQLSRGWRLGARFRVTSGNPYTPVVNRYYDLDEQAWYPIFDASRTERMRAWWAVDLRADKEWTFRRWALALYLDLQNATNHKNVELLNFTPDYSEEVPVYGLPVLPAFGLRASW